MVMGGDSFSEDHGFKSQHRKLDEYFLYCFGVKIVLFVCSKDKNKQKDAGKDPFR